MALSNMKNEPRRELTESFLGITFTIVFLLADYKVAHWLASGFENSADRIGFTVVFMAIGGCIVPLVIALAHLTHWLGDKICDCMGTFNLDPRPKNRKLPGGW